MIEDVKLMAEFMGYGSINKDRSGGLSGVLATGKLCAATFSPVPVYSKDMNALLGVMDKMDKEHSWPLDGAFCCGAGLITWACARHTYGTPFTDLPTVLFPLLVEAIKQINKCSVDPVGRRVRVLHGGKEAVCVDPANDSGKHKLDFENGFVGWYVREDFEVIDQADKGE